MPDDERDLPIGDKELSKLEEIVDEAMEDSEVEIGIDLDKDGKPDVFLTLKGKVAMIVGIIAAVALVTKISGLW